MEFKREGLNRSKELASKTEVSKPKPLDLTQRVWNTQTGEAIQSIESKKPAFQPDNDNNPQNYEYIKSNNKKTGEVIKAIVDKSNELEQTKDHNTSKYEILQKAALNKMLQILTDSHPASSTLSGQQKLDRKAIGKVLLELKNHLQQSDQLRSFGEIAKYLQLLTTMNLVGIKEVLQNVEQNKSIDKQTTRELHAMLHSSLLSSAYYLSMQNHIPLETLKDKEQAAQLLLGPPIGKFGQTLVAFIHELDNVLQSDNLQKLDRRLKDFHNVLQKPPGKDFQELHNVLQKIDKDLQDVYYKDLSWRYAGSFTRVYGLTPDFNTFEAFREELDKVLQVLQNDKALQDHKVLQKLDEDLQKLDICSQELHNVLQKPNASNGLQKPSASDDLQRLDDVLYKVFHKDLPDKKGSTPEFNSNENERKFLLPDQQQKLRASYDKVIKALENLNTCLELVSSLGANPEQWREAMQIAVENRRKAAEAKKEKPRSKL